MIATLPTNLREHEPLARYSSWRIGGPARFFAEASTPAELRQAIGWAQQTGVAWHMLGGGSNTLVGDVGYPGLIVRYRAQQVVMAEHGDAALVKIDAGALTAGTVRRLTRLGWGGLEWAEGVPGTIGGAVYGNAGCYGGDIAGSLTRAWLLVGDDVQEWDVGRFGYGYRTSVLKQRRPTTDDRRPTTDDERQYGQWSVVSGRSPVILSAEFALRRGDPIALTAAMEQTALARRGKTPPGNSCGSVFKNPPGQSAGQLIEAAGLKGTTIGGAQIAEKHANYIVNRGDASSADVLRLIELARETVLRVTGVALQPEVEVLA